MDAETRAALETAMASLEKDESWPIAFIEEQMALLQAFLDGEKGGCSLQGVSAADVSQAAPSSPPDSPAKIAADMSQRAEEWERMYAVNEDELRSLAARVEALGLEPSEREAVSIPASMWNRRTPDLTEALARLKALEEEISDVVAMNRKHDADISRSLGVVWTKEIAAIRKELGASDAEPTPAPEP